MVVPNPDPATPLRIYVAGPLFSEAERAWLDTLATALRAAGHECFVPHEESAALTEFTGRSIYQLDGDGLRSANVLVAWLDGIGVDDGTACEIGIFAELVRSGGPQYRGIVGIVTDLRLQRRRGAVPGDGLNLFVAGAIESAGSICWSVDEALAAVARLA
ncbi:MAG: hypothetical protein F2663_02910 [Actinobacteria bacterium]|uniref:Unannotated protein n=1 Tax=freshwater metagenome TaxID=449393 RepID=A0A6J6NYM5_9ZZZZ|nr:hypothetical protein [Actinomycetota bacterium]